MASDAHAGPEPTLLDVRGLLCPLPVLKARKAIGRLRAGDRLLVEATDPMAAIDIPHFCTENGHRLVSVERGDEVQRYLIEKG